MATNEAVEIVNFKVTGVGAIPKPELKAFAVVSSGPASPVEVRRAYFGEGLRVEAPVYRRRLLAPGTVIAGPAIIEEQTSTVVLYPGQTATVDTYLNLEIDVAHAD
jgi:N-methylhydantoinase A